MKIGYARVSTEDQSLDGQRVALEAAGCARIFTDRRSGARQDRDGLDQAMAALSDGDVLVVCRLDRLARSLRHLLDLTAELTARGAALHSLSEAIETDSAAGRLMLHILAALGEFERGLISERTSAGMAAARKSGKRLGRKPRLSYRQIEAASLAHRRGRTIDELARDYGVGRSTLYRALPLKAPN